MAERTGKTTVTQEVQAIEANVSAFLEAAPDAMVIVGKEGRILFVNGQVESLFGYRRDELVGQRIEILIPERYRDKHPSHREAFFTGPRPHPMGAGVDLFAVETMMFPQEATAAIRACKAVTDLPVMATMFFQFEELHDRDRTMWGESPGDVAKNLLAAGADVVGMNCGRGPDRAITIIREMRRVTDAPLVAYPNAGLPVTTGDTAQSSQ